jgi:peptidyl-tRNA hydrolase, PTH1 family
MWLVVGLGNPGREYAHHRHNIGFAVADLLADRIGARFGRHRRASALVAEGWLGQPGGSQPAIRMVIAKPMTFMNLSGSAVASLAQFYKIEPGRIVAVHDELDLPFGQIRAKLGGGEGGHNGLRSMSAALGTKDYLRVRLGIGRPPGRRDPADFVLSEFTPSQRKELDLLVDRAADLAESIITRGLAWTQNAYHGDPEPPDPAPPKVRNPCATARLGAASAQPGPGSVQAGTVEAGSVQAGTVETEAVEVKAASPPPGGGSSR